MAKGKVLHYFKPAAGIFIAAVGAAFVQGASTWAQWIEAFGFSLLYTTLLWVGNLGLMAKARQRLPGVENTGKRLVFMLVFGTAFTLATALLLDYALQHWLLGERPGSPHKGSGVRTSLIMTYLVCAILEAQYYFSLWKEANQRAVALQQTSLQIQINQLKAELNPHFLFNNFNTLAAVIEEDPAKATRMVHELSKYYRYVLQAGQQSICTLADELASLEAYTYLLQIRHESAFQIEVQVSEACLPLLMPPLTLQLLAENAVKHNSATAAHPLHLQVLCSGGGLVTVRNNQIPRQGRPPGAGIGLANLQERFYLLGLGAIHYETTPDGWFTVQMALRLATEGTLPPTASNPTPINAHTVA